MSNLNKNREKISEALQAAKEITKLQKVYIHPNRKLSGRDDKNMMDMHSVRRKWVTF